MSRLAFKRARGASEIFLDEDVYVVMGDSGRSSTVPSVWPAVGSYGPVPKGGIAGRPEEVLDSIGPELWKAKRQGHSVCLLERCEHYGPATALLWAADCVEHLAKRAYGVDGNVVEALAMARRYATEHLYHSELADPLMAEIDKLLKRLRGNRLQKLTGVLIAEALDTAIVEGGAMRNATYSEHRAVWSAEEGYEKEALSTAEQRSMQIAMLQATKELCGADPLLSAREAARYCRKAAGGKELAKHGDDGQAETLWQAEQLLKYLEPPPTDQAQAS